VNAQLDLKLDLTPGDHGAYVVKDREIVFKTETTQPEWESITRQLAELNAHTASAHVRVMFLLGDALNFGERQYGEECTQAIDATREHMRLSMKSVENAAWVASKIAPQDRHELLTMAHHEAVARLEPSQQRKLLDEAQSEALPVSKLRAKVREIAPSRPKTIKPKKKRGEEAITTQEDATAAASTLLEYATPFLGKRKSELTPNIRKAFEPYAKDLYAFFRRFTRKENW